MKHGYIGGHLGFAYISNSQGRNLHNYFGGYIDPNEGLGAKNGELLEMSYSMAIITGLFRQL